VVVTCKVINLVLIPVLLLTVILYVVEYAGETFTCPAAETSPTPWSIFTIDAFLTSHINTAEDPGLMFDGDTLKSFISGKSADSDAALQSDVMTKPRNPTRQLHRIVIKLSTAVQLISL
jgi:hypothetical protein